MIKQIKIPTRGPLHSGYIGKGNYGGLLSRTPTWAQQTFRGLRWQQSSVTTIKWQILGHVSQGISIFHVVPDVMWGLSLQRE